MASGRTIYHVSFGDDANHYFGSLAAIFTRFTPSELGVSLSKRHAGNVLESVFVYHYKPNFKFFAKFCNKMMGGSRKKTIFATHYIIYWAVVEPQT